MSLPKLDQSIKALGLCACSLAAIAVVSLAPAPAFSQESPSNTDAPADNTHVNQRDRSPDELTADQAGQHLSDRQIMRAIRKSIVKDHSLSTYAHNIKIISLNGTVTLKGPVRSEEEKQNIIDKATAVASEDHVIDQLSVR